MKLYNILKSKNYLSKIYLWVATAIVILVSVFSVIVYINVDRIVVENEYKTNNRILNHVRYNIEYMDDMIKNLCISTFLNPDTIYMMFDKSPDYDDLTMKVNRIRATMVDVNPYVDSIYIYNNNAKAYFTTNNGLFYKEKELEQLISQYGTALPKMKPVLRVIPNTSPSSRVLGNKSVLTYFVFDNFNNRNIPDGAVVVNIKSEWLYKSIAAINSIGDDSYKVINRKDSIYVIDNNGQYLVGNKDNNFDKALKASMDKQLLREKAIETPFDSHYFNKNTFIMDNKGVKFFISYINIDKIGWTIVKTQAFNETYKYINQLRISIVVITVIFIVIALVLSITVTRSIYKPVGNLIKQISGENFCSSNNKIIPKDEFSFLSDVYNSSKEQLKEYKNEKFNNRNIMKTYLLKKLLVDSHSVAIEELDKSIHEFDMTLNFSENFAVCIIKMDDYEELKKVLSSKDRDLFKFAILNITSEVFAHFYCNEGLDIREDHVVIILNPTGSSNEFVNRMKTLISEAQGHIMKYYNISISMTVSDIGKSFEDVTKLYNTALSNSMYSYVSGKLSAIFPEDFCDNIANKHTSFSSMLERKLGEEIKSGNIENIDEIFKKILGDISKLSYKNMMLSVMHLVNIISDTVEEINKTKIEPIYTDYNMFQQILDMSTIEDLYNKSMELFRQITCKSGSAENEKHIILVEAIKDIINANYQQSGLCLQQIADILKMSQVYIGKIFRGITQISVAEYITEVRLKKAAELLEKSNLSINEIVLKIGMENESYFYKLFKKKYGSTPKEYCLNMAVRRK